MQHLSPEEWIAIGGALITALGGTLHLSMKIGRVLQRFETMEERTVDLNRRVAALERGSGLAAADFSYKAKGKG